MRLLPVLLMMLVSACETGKASNRVFCHGTIPALANAHADALIEPGVPDPVVVTGDALIAGIDAGCSL